MLTVGVCLWSGGVRVLAVVRLLFGCQWVGDAVSDSSVFVPGAALSQQSLAAPRWRRKIYIKQKAVKGCVFIWGGREAWLRCPLPTFHIHPADAAGR